MLPLDGMMNGLVGLESTPLGAPARVNRTLAVKPFCADTEMVIGTAVVPCKTDRELAESVIAKSGGGVEDGGLTFDDGLPAPPQPAPTHSKVTTALLDARFRQLRTLGCSAWLPYSWIVNHSL